MKELQFRQSLAAAGGGVGGKFAGVDQDRKNLPAIGAGVFFPPRDQPGQIFLELADGTDAGVELFGLEHRLKRAENAQRPSAQRASFVLRHAEQIADQLHRDGGGKIVDQIDDARARGIVQ